MSLPTVIVTRQLPRKVWDHFAAYARLVSWEADCPVSREWLLEHITEAEGLYCLLTDRVDQEVLQSGKRLRVISTMSVGFDHIDVQACTRRSIPVGHTPGILTETTADLAWALLMAAARRIVEGVEYVRQGKWTDWSPDLLLGQDLFGATLGIVGFGRIGQAMARRAQGFTMKVLAVCSPDQVSHSPRPLISGGLGSQGQEGPLLEYVNLQEALVQSDFVSLHVPLTSQTEHLIGASELQLMKPSGVLVNTARGAVVDTEALYQALQKGEIAAAALDVTDPEPLPASHPLLTLPNCLVIPHLGSASVATRTRMAFMAVENVIAGLRGDVLSYCANPEVYAGK